MPRSQPLAPRPAPALGAGAVLACTAALGGCVDPVGMVASGVAQAAIKTAIEQAEKSRPTPQQLWHRAQLASLERRAAAGDAEAQYRLGTYYLLLRDPAAEPWICEAANQGHARAQLQYGHWFNEDRAREDLFPFITLRPDNATAYLWYELAARNGEPRAPFFRDSLIHAGIAAGKLEQGRARAARGSPGPCPRPLLATAGAAPANRAAP